jgi:predicted chitinase
MAKQTKFELSDDGFDFGADLEMPDFGNADAGKKDYKKVSMSLSKAAAKGALDGLTEEGFIRRTIRSALPSGYGTALDIADEATSTLRSLYNDSVKEIKPLLNDLKRVTKRLEDPIDKYLPKPVSDMLKKFSSSIDQPGQALDPEAQREATLQANLAEVFKHTVVSQAKREQQADARSKVREQIDQIRHKDSMGQLNEIRLSVARMAAYDQNVTSQYQRKSLELQFRQFFVMRDIHVEQRRMNQFQEEALRQITANTGAPDYMKMTEAVRLKKVIRNKFAEFAEGGLFGDRKDFFRNLGKNIRDVVGDRVRNAAYGAQMGLQNIDQASEMFSMMQEMNGLGIEGSSPGEIAVGMAGNMAAQHFGGKAVNWVKNKIPTTGRWGTARSHVNRVGSQLSYLARTAPQQARGWAEGWQGLPFVPEFVSNILREAILRDQGPDRNLRKDQLKNMSAPGVFTNQVAKSITEVIPGYLSRIYREIQVMRTGDESTELTRYNFQTNKFDTHSGVRKHIFNSLISKSNSDWMRADMNRLIQFVDPDHDRKLNDEQRKALEKQLTHDYVRGNAGRVERYLDPSQLYQAGSHSTAISDAFQERFASSKEMNLQERERRAELQNKFAAMHQEVGGTMRLARATIQDLADAGLLDTLENLGVVDEFGNIEFEKIADYHLNRNMPNEGIPGRGAMGRRTPRKRPGAAGPTSRGGPLGRGPGGGGRQTTINNYGPTGPAAPAAAAQAQSNLSGDHLKGVIDAIKANNNLTILEKVSATLTSIENEIKAGVVMYNAGDVTAATLGPDGKPFLDRSLREHWRMGQAGAKSGLQRAWNWWKEPGWGSEQWNKRGEHWNTIKQKAKDTWQWGKDKIDDMTEVYIKGELQPRLTAWGMKAGMYYGKTEDGKMYVIRKWSDIKGAVFDENGKPIMTAQEAMQAFARTTVGMKAIKVADWVKKQALAGWELAKSTSGMVNNAIVEAGKKGMEYLNAQDVYVKSDLKNPKLQATIMRARGYRSQHRRDKFIMSPADIDGPVVNLTGDVVLTDNDIREGLVDKYGRELKSGKLRLLQVGADTFNWGIQKVKNAWNMTKDFLSGKWQGFQNWFKIDGIAFSGGKTIIERLTEIRDLLSERLPKRKKVLGDVDGNGIREGSVEDQEKKGEIGHDKGTSAADTAKEMAKKFGEKGTSLYGWLGGGAMSLLNAFKKRRAGKGGEEEAAKGGESTLDEVADGAGILSSILPFIPGGKLLKKGGGALLKGGKWGLGKLGTGLKMANKSRGFVSAEEAARAALGTERAGKFAFPTAASMAGEAGTVGDEALKVAEAAKQVGGTSKLMSVMGALKSALGIGAKAGAKGAVAGVGGALNLMRQGNVATAKMAGSALKGGAKLAGKGLWGATKLGAKGVGLGLAKGVPWLAKDIGKNALKLGKWGGGLGLGIGLDLAAHAANASGHTTIGTGLDYAGDAVTGYGLAGTAAGLLGIEGGALGLAGTLLGAVFSPVGLAIGAAAGIGYGAYKLYKWSKTKNLTDMAKLRYIQYGFAENDNDHWKAVFALEDVLQPNVVFVNGSPKLVNKGLKEEDLLEPFGVDKTDREALQNWLQWFTLRFRPIFLVHMTALHKENPSAKGLKEIEDLKPASKKKSYFDHAKWPGGPYRYKMSPFKELATLPSGDVEVAAYAAKIDAKLNEEVKKEPKDPKAADAGKKTVGTIVGAAKAAQVTGHVGEDKGPNWQSVKGAGTADPTGKISTNVATTGATVTIAGKFDPTHMSTDAHLDGLTCIRLKTYGLRDMNIDKVQTLLRLEVEVQKNIKVNDKFVASWTGNLQQVFAQQAPAFGIVGAHTTNGYNWVAWFNLRFLPTYIAYVTGLATATKKDEPRAAILTLKPQDALTVAGAIKSATGTSGPVWGIKQMPWPNYEGNMDVKSTDVNYAGLQDLAGKTKFKEAVGVPGAGDKSGDKAKPGQQGGGGIIDSAKKWVADKWNAVTHDSKGNLNTFGKVTNTVGTVAGKVIDANVALGKAAYNAVTGGGGAAANSSVGKPISANAAKVKGTLLAALKAAGITNPQEVAMFLGQMDVESGGFRTLSENLNYKPDRLASVFPKYFHGTADAQQVAAGGPEAIADRVYGGRMGNTQPGDGFKFRGRGVIQLTGRANYAKYGKAVGVDLLSNPDAASDPELAAKIAIAYWKDHGASGPAQQGNVQAVTQLINGGQNGASDRAAKYKQYLAQATNGGLTAGGQTLTTADSGQKTGAQAAAATAATPGAAAPGAGVAGAGSKGTGAPSGFGGSPSGSTAAGGPAPTVFSAMAGKGNSPSSSQANLSAAPAATPAGPSDPFAVPNMGPAAAMGTGFSPNAARSATDMMATRAAQAAASSATAVPSGDDVGMRQLKVQQDMLVALQSIAKAVGGGASLAGAGQPQAGGPGNSPDSMQSTIAAGKMASQRAQPMKQNLLSVAKPTFS